MGEEAGFLAAIRGNPGDATARLVYADWLDERDDPRGEYLRLFCAAAGWSELPADRAATLDRLQRLGAGLPRDWKAVVQRGANWRTLFEANLRPPEERESGEEFHFGPPATAEQLDAAERALGVPLPADVRAMWSEFNGVRWTDTFYRQNGRDPEPYFHELDELRPAIDGWGEWGDWEGSFDAEHGPGAFRKLLLIHGDSASAWVLCREAVAGHPAGAVVFYDHDVFELAPLADSLFDLVCRRFTERFSHW